MKRAFEAIWEQGKVIPTEPININDHTRLLVVILEEHGEQMSTISDWRAPPTSSSDAYILPCPNFRKGRGILFPESAALLRRKL